MIQIILQKTDIINSLNADIKKLYMNAEQKKENVMHQCLSHLYKRDITANFDTFIFFCCPSESKQIAWL